MAEEVLNGTAADLGANATERLLLCAANATAAEIDGLNCSSRPAQ